MLIAATIAALMTLAPPDSTHQDSTVQNPDGTTFLETTPMEMLTLTALSFGSASSPMARVCASNT